MGPQIQLLHVSITVIFTYIYFTRQIITINVLAMAYVLHNKLYSFQTNDVQKLMK